jgi:mannosylglycerate hydrolase
MTRPVNVVAHTHWDREWYAPFEAFRARLVGVLDGLLAGLERDRSFTRFLLDGQIAVIDDYLAVRPEARDTVVRLARTGRLALGPWYILMDEFCVSGETIIRNLQLGLRRAEELGNAMTVGYLPDMFGHIAQMPQLLRLAGFEHAVVWRGVPAAIDRTAFRWRAPDGSTVRAEYLPVGYANGAFLPDEPDAFIRRVQAHEAEVAPFLAAPSTPLLLMNGTDHQPAQLHMPALLRAANALQDRFDFRQMSLTEHLAAVPSDGWPEWTGELRSGARANILMGVLSNRVDIKVAAATVERSIERLAEPLAALWLTEQQWPAAALEEAWLAIIHNSAHDSICACSADQVGRAVVQRYDSAAALAGEVTQRALDLAGVATQHAGVLVINPGPVDAGGVIETVLPGCRPVAGTQVLSVTEDATIERRGEGADLGRILAEIAGEGWLVNGRGVDAAVSVGPDGLEVRIESDETRRPSVAMASVMAEAWAQAGAHRHDPLLVRVDRRASQRVAARVAEVPGYGWAPFRPSPPDGTEVRGGADWLDNSLVRLEVDPDSGTFSINGLAGMNRLVDTGDEGDTYTYSPLAADTVIDRPESVRIEPVEHGPARGRLTVSRRFVWPAALAQGGRVGRVGVDVVSEIELRAGEELVRVTTRFDNPSRDHRLRAWFPLPCRTDHTVAECAFTTVTRGAPEGSVRELPQATFPSRRFVTAGGLTLTHEGLLEYELVEGGTALALTLLRSTGILSRPTVATRPNRAGPAEHVEGAQLLGAHRVRYALTLAPGDPWRVADQAWLPLFAVTSSGTGRLPPSGSRLTVRGAQVSALHRVDGALELRVYNPTDTAATVEVPGHAGWLVDFRGRQLERWDGRFPLRPWGIATALLDARSLDSQDGLKLS